MKVLNSYEFKGTFQNKDGDITPYETVFLLVQIREGQFPRQLHFNKKILRDMKSSDLVGKEIKCLYSKDYGKEQVAAIQVIEKTPFK